MFDIGSLYRWESVHKKFKPEFRVLLLGKTDLGNVETVVTGWGSIDKLAVNKIGYVSEIPKGGSYSFVISLPGNDHLVARAAHGGADTKEECVKKARDCYRERVELIEKMKEPSFALMFELEHFDFYYSYSDDYRYWASGQAAQKRIEKLCAELGLDASEQMKLAFERKGK